MMLFLVIEVNLLKKQFDILKGVDQNVLELQLKHVQIIVSKNI